MSKIKTQLSSLEDPSPNKAQPSPNLCGAVSNSHHIPQLRHYCYLLGTIIHNPQKDSLPVVKNIQLASSKTITTLHDGSIPEANSITVIMFETDSLKSYQDASDQMVTWLQSNYCPSWIKERIKESGPDFPDFERFKRMMSLTNDARKYVTRPIYSFAGAVLEDDLFNGTF